MQTRPYVFRLLAGLILFVGLSGCFESDDLFNEQRLWDETWQQRYVSGGIDYIVIANGAASRTYLIGAREAGKELEIYRAALYPGWDDYLILGTQKLPSSGERAVYNAVRRLSPDKVELVTLACGESTGDAGKGSKPASKPQTECNFRTLDALRQEMKKELAAQKSSGRLREKVQTVKLVPTKAFGSIGAETEFGTYEDNDGVHGALRVKTLTPGRAAAKAGLRVGELIVAVDGGRSLTARALEVLIAFAKPGEKLRLTLYDPTTRTTRDIVLTAVA